ncbi:MAG: tape measure protein, partial [Desulfobacteraceae bacterium]
MPSDAYLKVILEAKDLSAKGFRSFQNTVAAVTRSVFSLQGGLASLGVALTGREIFDAGRNMAQLEKAFTEITGSTAAMGQEFDFVRDVAERMGQNFYDLIPTYKGLLAASQGTNLEGAKTRDIFAAITKASATLGLSSEQTAGALRAIEQMMSKGKVQAEELRGQLGERLPGAFKLAAEAMGVTTAELNKMLDDGKVLADDLLPKLADVLNDRYSGAVDKATQAVNKLSQA